MQLHSTLAEVRPQRTWTWSELVGAACGLWVLAIGLERGSGIWFFRG